MFTYKISGQVLNNSDEFSGLDKSLDVDFVLKLDKILEESEKVLKPKVIALDIETEEFEIGKGKILMIALVSEKFKKVLTWKKSKSKENYVELFKDEEEMLQHFEQVIKKESPDILTGYFSDNFDLPYIRSRAEKLKVKMNLGKDNSRITFSRGRMLNSKIKGIVHIDVFRFIEKAYSQYMQSETLSLADVSQELLGETKIKIEHLSKQTQDIKEHEWDEFFQYNLQDTILTYKLFEKIWQDLIGFTRVMQEPLFDVSRDGMSQHVEDYLIHNLKRFNEIIENKPTNDEIRKRIALPPNIGAFVLQPEPKLYENLAMFDFTSYWPSIIVTFNLSKSTYLGEKKSNENAEEIEVENKKYYFSKQPGFFPELLKEIVEKRKQYKQELKKQDDPIKRARSNAYKLLANASYGYLGFAGGRYYSYESQGATTGISRDFIKRIIDKVNNKDYRVIYADTDSMALLLNEKSKQQTLDFLQELNKTLPGIMELELEDFYKRGIFVTKRTGEFGAKKKYALINDKGKLKIRGF
ncbi:MAG: DNA-directed DNA polymerase, partial [Nanoarchaeota archaeon]